MVKEQWFAQGKINLPVFSIGDRVVIKNDPYFKQNAEGQHGTIDWIHGNSVSVSFNNGFSRTKKIRYFTLTDIEKV